MATISFGGAPGVYINEVAGQSATPAIAAFSTVYMLVEVAPEVPTTLFPFNQPVQVTNTREYQRLIGGVIPTTKIELLSYQCVDAFFAQSYVGDLRVIRVGTPANVMEVQLNPSGFKTNGLGVSSPLQAGDKVYAQLLINGARLGEFTASGTWKGVPVNIPVDYIDGLYDNNKKIAIAIRDAVAEAISVDPNVAAGTIVRDLGVCQQENAECAYEYLAGREFNAPVSVVPESEPPSDGSYYVFTLNTYTVGPIIPNSENTNELVADYLQCLRTAFVDQEDQGYLTAPCAFAKFGPTERRLIGQEMAFQAELNSHKWMAIADAGPYNVTDIIEYNGFVQHEAAAPLKTGQEFLVDNSVYEWTADNTDYLQLRYAPLSGGESNPEQAVNASKNTNVPFDRFLSLRDNGEITFATSTTAPYDRPGLLDLSDELWPSTKEPGTSAVLSNCVGSLAEYEGQTVYVVPTYLTPSDKTFTGYIYFAETYPEAITAYNWIIGKGGLDGDGTPAYPGVSTLPPGCLPIDTVGSGELGDAVTGVVITNPGSGYNAGDEPDVAFSAPTAGGRTATGYAVVGGNGGVDFYTLSNGGNGYTVAPTVNLTPLPGDPGTGASATCSLATSGGRVTKVTLSSGGAGYETTPSVAITTSGSGTGAAGFCTLSSTGSIKSVTLGGGGSNWTSTPTVSAVGSGTGFVATATLATTGGSFLGLTSFVAGSDYSANPTVTLTGGTGGNVTATLQGSNGNIVGYSFPVTPVVAGPASGTWQNTTAAGPAGIGTISGTWNDDGAGNFTIAITSAPAGIFTSAQWPTVSCTIEDVAAFPNPQLFSTTVNFKTGFPLAFASSAGGSNYTSAAAITITPAAGDTTGGGASATPEIGFPIASLTVSNGGSGYGAGTSIAFARTGGDTTGGGAAASATIGYSVSSVTLTAGGTGFTFGSPVTVAFSGGNPTSDASATGTLGFPVAAITPVAGGANYLAPPVVSFTPNLVDAGNLLSSAAATCALGFGVTEVVITDAGSGYSASDVPSVTFSGGTPTTPATAICSLQAQGTGLLSYEVPAWDLYVEIDGQTSDLILNTTNTELDLNTLHLPGTLQNSTQNYQLAQFTRGFTETNVTKENPAVTASPAVFNCLNHGLVNGAIIYFTTPLTKIGGGTLVNASTQNAVIRYYVSVINGNQFRLATTLANLNAQIFIQFPNGGLTVGQTTQSYSGLLIAPENTNLFSNEGVVNLIRGRKYGFNTYNVLSTFYPANVDPLTGAAGLGLAHDLGFYRIESQVDPKYYSAYGEFDAGFPDPGNAGFLGDLQLQLQDTVNYFCSPLFANERSDQAYITASYTNGAGTKIVLWGASLKLRYTAYQEAPSNLWRFNAVPPEEVVDYALRGTFNEGVPACVLVATGIDDTQKLLDDSQQYYNPRGFIAYYGPYLKNASGAWIPPSPYVTGVAIRRYRSEGFQYPPAGVKFPLNGVSAVQIPVNSTQQDILNPRGCNVCRTLPGYGSTVFIWGGRTRINQQDAEQRLFQFVNTRVIMNVVYGSLRRAFDSQIFNVIDGFGLVYNKIISIGNSILNELYVRGALFGRRPGDAFQVICDERIQTSAGLESGIVRAKVFVVPVPTLERIEVDLIRVAIGNMQNELDALGVGQDNAI
jgi:hypothetical protein